MDSHQHGDLATHYQVLNLTPTILDEQQDPSSLVKRAYRRALLQNHPDKASASAENSGALTAETTSRNFSIDQITTAFTVLSSPSQRAAYNAALRLQQHDGDVPGLSTKFQTGVEIVDLDDLPFSETDACWHRACRCGNDRGYLFHEQDLEEAGDEGELMVGCMDCSLWLKVHFAVVEDEDEPEPEGAQPR